jgi:hypothetical protein
MCIICERGNEPSQMKYTETTGDEFRWMTKVNQARGKKCNYCKSAKTVREKKWIYGLLRPYPIYLGEEYEIARGGGSPSKFASHRKSITSKAFHADFGCHRFTLEPIDQSLFINHFERNPDRIINGLEVLRDIAVHGKTEWIEQLISSDNYSNLIKRLHNVQTANEGIYFERIDCCEDDYCKCWKCRVRTISDDIFVNLSYKPIWNIEVGCIVEILTGAFKGDKARVTSVSDITEEVSMVLYEQAIPMELKLRREHVKIIY